MADDGPSTRGDLKPAGVLALLGLYAVAAPPVGLAALVAASTVLDPFWERLPTAPGFVLAVALGTVLVGCALLPSIGFAGYVGYVTHGDPWGYVLVALSIVGATHLGLAWARRLSSTAARQLLSSHPAGRRTLDAMEQESSRSLMGLVFMSRLSPHVPFAFTNIVIAQLHQPLYRLALISTLGLLPRSLLAVAAGGSLRSLKDWTKLSPGAWTWLITALVFACFAWLFVKARRRARARAEQRERSGPLADDGS